MINITSVIIRAIRVCFPKLSTVTLGLSGFNPQTSDLIMTWTCHRDIGIVTLGVDAMDQSP